jgi:hypothetical protein
LGGGEPTAERGDLHARDAVAVIRIGRRLRHHGGCEVARLAGFACRCPSVPRHSCRGGWVGAAHLEDFPEVVEEEDEHPSKLAGDGQEVAKDLRKLGVDVRERVGER